MFEVNKRNDIGIDVIAEENVLEHPDVASFETTKKNMKHLTPQNPVTGHGAMESFSDYGGRSPDTWADFEAENGMLTDRDTQRDMMLQMDNGELAGSLYGT